MRPISLAFISRLAAFLAACSISAPAHAHVPDPGRISFFRVEPPPLVKWSELCDSPGTYRGRPLRLVVQVHSVLDDWNPYLTRFGSGQFHAVQAWSDEQRLWVHDEFDSGAVRLFARRGGACEAKLKTLAMYERYEVEGVLREVFLDQPWIEIDHMERLAESVTEGTIIHAARALELEKESAWDLALLELEQALAGNLPAHVLAELEAERESVSVQTRSAKPIKIEKR